MLSRHRGDIGRQIRTLGCRDDEDMKERGLEDQRTRTMKDKGKMNVDDESRAVDLGELWVDKSCPPRLHRGREDLWEITYNYKVLASSFTHQITSTRYPRQAAITPWSSRQR